ncbi:MAG: glycosyltransferase [Verrucomicrobia bacterium]|nr:glycosyltransferase [Verrucomicrobiota bacterium]
MSNETPLISVVVPAYNRRDSVLLLLADLYRQEGVSFEVIIVDDCSPDDTVAAIQTRYPQVKVLRNAVNSGPAVSRNQGVRAACGKYIAGFDSDVTLPDPALLRNIVSTFEQHPEATGLALRLLAADGKSEDRPRWWHAQPFETGVNRAFATHYFSGTGYAFRREEMLSAGLYPEILYMHYEEVELAFRILDAGGTIRYCPDLPVVHHASPVAARGKIHKFYKPRNQILVAVACYPWPRAIVYLLPRIGYSFIEAIRHWHLGEFFRALASASLSA